MPSSGPFTGATVLWSPVRTLVVSDLHLGAATKKDTLRRAEPLRALCEHLQGFDRLAIVGDAVELRHGPRRDAIAAAEPVFAALGKALGRKGEIVLVTGNHDHGLISPWLEARGEREEPAPLTLEERAGADASPLLARLARAAKPARFDVAFPGVWLREDVYAMHGHYLDCLTTIPALERLGAGVMGKIVGPLPDSDATPDDFEARLAPMYAWLGAIAESRGGRWATARQGTSASAWQLLSSSSSRRPLRARAMVAAFPFGIAGLNRAGLGPLTSELSGENLRREALAAMADVVRRLNIQAEHVIFGHTHRSGPLVGDEGSEWRAGASTQLHNPGCWIDEPVFARQGGVDSPYRAGRAIELDAEGPPRLVRVTESLGLPEEQARA
jgi:predicted phosphodiesterase